MKHTFSSSFLLLALIISSCSYFTKSEEAPAMATPALPPKATVIDAFVTKEDRLENIINSTGSLMPNESVQISPERAGKLVKINFSESSYVEAGSILAKIDDQELVAQLEKLKVQERIARKEVERATELRKIDAIPQDEFERLESTHEQIEAEINLLDVQIEKAQIKAPFSGLIGLRNLSLGAYVTPSESIAELQQTDPLKLEFDVPEKYMREVNKGQKVTFDVVGFAEPFSAVIYATSVEVAANTRTFKVRARCPNPNKILRPGNFAKVAIITGVNEHAIMVPSDAVIPIIDGQKLFVARAGVVEERMVETGAREGVMIEITSGLAANDTVIVSGLLALSAGMPVEVANIVEYSKHLN